MNTTAAATQANVTVATIRTWCRRGVIAAVKAAGRWVIDAASLARRIEIGARRMSNPADTLSERTLHLIRRARAARPHHGPAVAGRYLLPSMGFYASYPTELEQGLVEALTANGRVHYVLTDKAVSIRAQLTA